MFLLYFVTVCYCEAVRLSTSSGRDRSEVVMSSYICVSRVWLFMEIDVTIFIVVLDSTSHCTK